MNSTSRSSFVQRKRPAWLSSVDKPTRRIAHVDARHRIAHEILEHDRSSPVGRWGLAHYQDSNHFR